MGAAGGSAPPGTCTSPGPSRRGSRDLGTLGPLLRPSRLTRPWPGPSAAPTHPEPRASKNPPPPAPGELTTTQLHLGTSTSGGVSPPCATLPMRNPPLRAWRAAPRSGQEARPKLRLRPSSACTLGGYATGGGGRGARRRRRQAAEEEKSRGGGGGASGLQSERQPLLQH